MIWRVNMLDEDAHSLPLAEMVSGKQMRLPHAVMAMQESRPRSAMGKTGDISRECEGTYGIGMLPYPCPGMQRVAMGDGRGLVQGPCSMGVMCCMAHAA